jgi:hypothetical protein
MLKSKSLMGALLAATLILSGSAFAAAGSSSSGDGSQSSSAPIKTVLRSDLTFKSVLVMPESSPTGSAKPAGYTAFLKTCRCSCGQPCTTNADCGPGGACGVGITCCNRTPGKNGLNDIFAQKDANSSSKNPSTAALAVNCNQ